MPKIHSDHRRRKNGASREAWEKKKAATNAARGPQEVFEGIDTGDGVKVSRYRVQNSLDKSR